MACTLHALNQDLHEQASGAAGNLPSAGPQAYLVSDDPKTASLASLLPPGVLSSTLLFDQSQRPALVHIDLPSRMGVPSINAPTLGMDPLHAPHPVVLLARPVAAWGRVQVPGWVRDAVLNVFVDVVSLSAVDALVQTRSG